MNYSKKEFDKDFGSERACLEYIFKKKYPDLKGYYFVNGRKCFANVKGKQIHPVKGTIFEHSSTPLTSWFYAIFLFSLSKNGVSAKELQSQLGVTYKTAWRIGYQIRQLMEQTGEKLSGTVEIDETYIGGQRRSSVRMENKSAVIGMVKRGGDVKAFKISNRQTHIMMSSVRKNVRKGSSIMTDEFDVYKKLGNLGYKRQSIKHSLREYVRNDVHTNTIEGFWGQLKRSISGTYHSVSKQHLQSYVDEFAFRYNHRASPVFGAMMARI